MSRIRGLPKGYKISETRFRELYYFCLQYNEWQKQRNSYAEKIKMVEDACMEASPELAPYIKEAVTNKGVTYQRLRSRLNIPCDRNTYYKYRRKFYWILDKKKT